MHKILKNTPRFCVTPMPWDNGIIGINPNLLGVKNTKKIKPIWNTKKGSGVIAIPSDPNELVKQLELRMHSFKAGNTGVRNEIVAMTDELLRQGVITKE